MKIGRLSLPVAGLAIAGLLPLGASLVQAQTAVPSPTSLLPLGAGAQQPGDNELYELAPPSGAGGSSTVPQGSTIIIQDLAPQGGQLLGEDLNAIGTLSQGNGGLGYDMWRQTPYVQVDHLLGALPERPVLPQAVKLSNRLLLTAAATPSQSGGAQSSPAELLLKRIALLENQNRLTALQDLVDRIPQSVNSIELTRARANSALFAGDYDRFCQDHLPVLLDSDISSTIYARYQVFCQIHQGETDRALLGLDLLREIPEEADPLFMQLALKAAGLQSPVTGESAGPVEAIHLALAEKSKTALPDSLLEWVHGDLLLKVLASDAYSVEQRLIAAEKALRFGAIEPVVLQELYANLTDVKLGIDRILAGDYSDDLDPSIRHAILWQEVSKQSLNAVKAELIEAAFEQAGTAEEAFLMALVYQDILASLEPTDDLIWFAGTAGRALYATGRWQEAGKWVLMAREAVLSSKDATAAVTSLWPYAQLASERVVGGYGNLNGWSVAQDGVADDVRRMNTVFIRALLQGVGVSEDMPWAMLAASDGAAQGLMPSAAGYFALKDAQRKLNKAEVVALALVLLGDTPSEELHPVTLGSVLEGLVEVGLEREARQLALEVAFLNSL
ncbi:hypothetical protein [Kiloniella sp. b19]|uniref:hypothetical protein n=1 Tax=Kiloniella sp. GXU_MW_B19 TaxID=3141326 RepID=UPI0031DC53F2